MARAGWTFRHQRLRQRAVFLFQRPQRRIAIDVVALRRVGFEHPEPVVFARRNADIGLRPASEVTPDLFWVARLPPLRAVAVLRGLVAFLFSGWSGENFPTAFFSMVQRGDQARI